ncbi:LexA family transcriptional regulator [Snodgrassella alvi]|uniref:LexA family transcriptional regulator n=1 Tax=Snodgrassella alvi TaxID=1196083 RepID=UPI003D08AAE3
MENFNVGFASRMQEVVTILKSVSELARKVEVAYPTASKWVKEGAEPSTTNLIKIADVAQVNLLWLATGKGPKFNYDSANNYKDFYTKLSDPLSMNTETDLGESSPDYADRSNEICAGDYTFIPVCSLQNTNNTNTPDNKALCTIAFNRNWLENYLNVDPQKLSTFIVKDDSMAGVFNDGDHVLINHGKKEGGDGLYVLRIGKNILVKRTQLKPNNQLLVTSANKEYEAFIVDLAHVDENFEIIGKVEWFGRKI